MKTQYGDSVLEIEPIHHPLDVSVSVPGSKSITNRSLLIAALAGGKTALSNALFSDDSRYLVEALKRLGFNIVLDLQRRRIEIAGLDGRIPADQANLYIGNAGTAARFLTAFLTLGNGIFSLDGDSRMRERPIGDLTSALVALGADIKTVNDQIEITSLPVKISAFGLRGGKTSVSGNLSSQFLSALLMTAPYASAISEILVTADLFSRPYIDLTIAVMADFGVEIEHDGYKRFLIRPAHYSPRSSYLIESDASAASYFFAAPAICGGSVRVENINRSAKQGDIKFLEILEKMGCEVSDNNTDIVVNAPSDLMGIDVDMRDIPDTAQTLAVLAPFASSPTCIRGIATARLKETDRISATCAELRKIGVQVEEHDDGMTIRPTREFNLASIKTYNDHRMAMAFALVGLRVPGISIENPGCVSKTFPDFFEVLELLK